jgi:hypothetical protein
LALARNSIGSDLRITEVVRRVHDWMGAKPVAWCS